MNTLRKALSVTLIVTEGGPLDGRHRGRAGGDHDRARRMRAFRPLLTAGVLLTLCVAALAAQDAPGETEDTSKSRWEFDASLFGYFVPQDRDYASPIVTADRGSVHLEGRYNYEGFHTGSLFIGWNLGVGEKLRLDATAMVGGVFGDIRGVAPGYELTLSYGRFELDSEGEYVFDLDDSSGNFFYNWAQLGYAPLDWLSVGLASQRTRAYQTGLDVQRGLFVGFSYKSLSLTTYVFNLGWETPTVVLSFEVSF